jgi:chromate transporter
MGVLVRHVPVRSLLWAFTLTSLKSWGGGTATIFVMHRELVRRGWISSAQFTLDFGLSRLVPGINLLAVAVILGYRLNGALGSIVSLLGLMLPASLVTLALTLGFAELTANPMGGAVVRGAVPVTAALTFALAYENGREIVPWGEWRVAILMACCTSASFVLVAVFHLSVALVIIAGILVGALLFGPPERNQP